MLFFVNIENLKMRLKYPSFYKLHDITLMFPLGGVLNKIHIYYEFYLIYIMNFISL